MGHQTAQQEGMGKPPDSSDSSGVGLGRIPGAPGLCAFVLHAPEPSALPVLVAVPHAGRSYPRALLRDLRNSGEATLRLEDRYVDCISAAVSRETGVATLVANAPRAMIDLNRAPDDVDWDMFARTERAEQGSALPSSRVRSGLGLIPRRLPGIGELWRRSHRREDLAARVGAVHEPYHQALGDTLEQLRQRWGAALFLDLHSMPPLPRRNGMPAASIVLGDRFGATCHGSIVAAAFAHFAESGVPVAHNRPYAGGYALDRHAAPRRGIHAMQVEIDRSTYLDSALREPGEGLGAVSDMFAGLVRRLAGIVASLGQAGGDQDWAQAAE